MIIGTRSSILPILCINKRKTNSIIFPTTMDLLSLANTALSLSTQLPRYILLSPLCIISSSLYSSVLGESLNDPPLLLMVSLAVMWGCAARGVLQLVRTRTSKCIFFYQFLASSTVVSFGLIGTTYSLLMREDPQEEVLAKVCATTLVVYAAERLKKDQGCGAKVCDICCLETHRQDCMALPCGHCFHEHCLWQWIYVRQVCPTCLRKLN